jgi:hypothetical protein
LKPPSLLTSDALWTGLPVLTCLGKTFAGRVAASLVNAVGLPELATQSLEEYEAPALKLARESALLSAYRERLEENRRTVPLFDADRFCAHLKLIRPCSTFTREGRLREASRSRRRGERHGGLAQHEPRRSKGGGAFIDAATRAL